MSEASRIAVLSGKGGVGKTNLVANVAVAASETGAKVLVVDGDLGLANVDVLLGLAPRYTVADVIEGTCSFEEALLVGPSGIHVLPAASGRSDLPSFRPDRLAGLLIPFFEVTGRYDLVLVDAGAGVGPAVITLAAACERVVLVVTDEPTSLTDAYATLKVLCREAPSVPVDVVVNLAASDRVARDVHERLSRVSERFLSVRPAYLGHLPRDPRLAKAVGRQRAVVELHPTAPSSRRFAELARELLPSRRTAGAMPTSRDSRLEHPLPFTGTRT